MSNQQPDLVTVYRIPREIYQSFNLAVTMNAYRPNAKKTTTQGAVELLVALVVTIWVITRPNPPQIVIILCVALMGLGLYSLTFYRYIFPRSILKTAGEKYDKSKYLQSEITLSWLEDRLVEQVLEQENSLPWCQVSLVREGEGYVALEVGKERTLLLPLSALGEQETQARALLEEQIQRYAIKREQLA